MRKIKNVDLEPFNNINDLYLAYKHDPFNEEVSVPFFDEVAKLATCIAPLFPTREDKLGNLGDIYITMHEFAMKSNSSDFLTDVINLINQEFGRHGNDKSA